VTQARKKQRGLRHGTRRFGEAVWRPFVRLSGVFFGIFALFALAAAVRLRAAWRPHSAGNTQLLVAVAMLVVFGYFCVSNFVRARRRERGR
jgi:Gpi18-like mannosyltransferase